MSSTENWRPRVGSRVKLQGLQGREADLNGRIGRVVNSLDKKTGCIGVRVLSTFLDTKVKGIVDVKPLNLADDPPTFLDGFEVVDSGDATLGRVSVATKDFRAGDLILVERPTFIYDSQTGYSGMMDSYMEVSEGDREKVLDMYCPAISEVQGEAAHATDPISIKARQTRDRLILLEHHWELYIRQKPHRIEALSLETAKRIIGIIDVNAHSYSLETPSGIVATSSSRSKECLALFARGSKVEHACAPNLTYSTEDGKLQYMASRAIAKGDRLSISYQTDSWDLPRSQRQEFLKLNKDFTCGCQRCLGPDECNPYFVSCTICKNTKAVAFAYGDESNIRCISCQSTVYSASILPQQEMEQTFLLELEHAEYYLRSGRFMREGPIFITRMISLQNAMAKKLHPLHWMHPEGYRLMSSMGASFARMRIHQGDKIRPPSSAVIGFLYLSTISLLYQARWIKRAGSIVYRNVELKDAVKDASCHLFPEQPSLQDIQIVADELCSQANLATPVAEMAHSLFHAGQDWILAGHAPQAAQLYESFQSLFERWNRLGDENREWMAILVNSKGMENQFPNHLAS